MGRIRHISTVDYFFNNDLKYLQGGISTMTYTTSITKTKVAQYDLLGIEDMVPKIWSLVKVTYYQRKTFYGYARGLESSHDVYSTKRILAVTQVEVMRKRGLTNLSGDDVSDFVCILNVHQKHGYSKESRRSSIGNPQGYIYVDNKGRNRLMRSDELYKFSDRTLTGLRTSLDDITKNIRMQYLPQRRWSTIGK
ncbi:hypothetical protein Tco_0100015 [Tanacetum coccineum]